jgi:flagellar M-ring protein FliF
MSAGVVGAGADGGATLPGLGEDGEGAGLELPDFAPAGVEGPGSLMEGFGADFGFDSAEEVLGIDDDDGSSFNRKVKEGPERRLTRMVEISEERAAKVLRKWAQEKAA